MDHSGIYKGINSIKKINLPNASLCFNHNLKIQWVMAYIYCIPLFIRGVKISRD